MRGLLDTSVFIGREQDRPLGALPDEGATVHGLTPYTQHQDFEGLPGVRVIPV